MVKLFIFNKYIAQNAVTATRKYLTAFTAGQFII